MITPIKISPFARRSSGGGFAPSNTVAPEITGTLEVGETLTCSTGTWTGTPTITYSYQWKRGVTNIGTDSPNYTQVVADIDQSITCTVTATNTYGNTSQVSNTVVTIFNRLSHGFKWAVDTENMTVISTTTTLIDYFGITSLANTAAAQQPTKITAGLNGFDILRWTTDDMLYASVANWMGTDTSGALTLVLKSNQIGISPIWGSGDESSTRMLAFRKRNITGEIEYVQNAGVTQSGSIIGTNGLGTSDWKIVTIASTGSAYKMFITTASEIIASATLTGGIWFNDLPATRDNLTLGGYKRSTTSYGDFDFFGAYYGSDFSDAGITLVHQILKQKLGL